MLQNRGRLILTLALVGAGCVANPDDGAGEYRAAIPPENSIQINVPGGAAGTTGEHTANLLGQTADFYAITRLTSERVNGDVGFVLAVLWAIVHTPPASISGNSATWGPFTPTLSPVNYRLVVTRVAPGQYSYHLDGRPKASTSEADFQALISGSATPSTPPGRGAGSFSVNLTLGHQMDPVGTRGTGSVAVSYDFSGNPKSISVHFANVSDDSGQPVTADYLYDRFDDGSGDFQFDAHANMVGTAAALEDGIIRSRWDASGAGRADARVSGGDAGSGLTVSECWNQSFQRVYFTANPAVVPTEGTESACAYASALPPTM
ncbi:MAG TPA: hypothetical protein VKN99_05585 [Polyangia bacterium]|nr:hypothetical protein [Polyangia bacterium]